MRKIGKSRSATDDRYADNSGASDERPRRVPGATVTAWRGSQSIDFDALVGTPSGGPTVAGTARATTAPGAKQTVALSDGTRITFANSF